MAEANLLVGGCARTRPLDASGSAQQRRASFSRGRGEDASAGGTGVRIGYFDLFFLISFVYSFLLCRYICNSFIPFLFELHGLYW